MQGVPGSIPGQGTRFCMAQPRSGTAKLKKKKNSMPQIQLSLVIRNVLLPNKDHGSHQGCVKVCHNKGSAYPEGTAVHLPPSEATHRGHERDLGVRILNEALFTRGGGSTGPGAWARASVSCLRSSGSSLDSPWSDNYRAALGEIRGLSTRSSSSL